MLSLKKLIAKVLAYLITLTNSITDLKNHIKPSTPTISISTTVGTLTSATVKKSGNVVQLSLITAHSGTTDVGDSTYEGTINTTGLRPLAVVTSGHYYGVRAITGNIAANGKIIIRNTGTTAISNMTNQYMTFTYIVN